MNLSTLRTTTARTLAVATLMSASLLAPPLAGAAMNRDFTNPAVIMSGEAVVASGACIAKYAVVLDDQSKPAGEIAQRVAKRCAREISRSAGLASRISRRICAIPNRI
jgi:uncharacterized protein YggE